MFGIAITVITALCHWVLLDPDVQMGISAIVGVDRVCPARSTTAISTCNYWQLLTGSSGI